MRRRVIFSIASCAAILLLLSVASYAADKVGYINLQRLVNESDMGKAARSDIQKLRSEKEAVIRNKVQEINDLRELINKEGNTMDAAEKRDKEKALKRELKVYQRLVEDAREDISNEDQELVAIILQKADPVLKKVAEKQKYSIILKDPDAIGYLDPSADITDDVLKELNK